MSSRIVVSKGRKQEYVSFGSAVPLAFDLVTLSASETSATIAARYPMPFAAKILAVSAVLASAPAGTVSLNVVEGPVAYEGAVPASGVILVAGSANPAGADTLTAVIGGTSATTPTFASGTSAYSAAKTLAATINANGTIAAIGTAYAVGLLNGAAVVQFVDGTPGAGGNSVTLAASPGVSSANHLSAVALSATLTGGLASGGTPVLPPTDTTKTGTVPSNTALTGNALFAADQPLTVTADLVQTLYPAASTAAFDAIWPKDGELTLRVVTNGSGAGTLKVVLLVQPVDQSPGQLQLQTWVPSPSSY